MTDPIISVTGVTRRFNDVVALDDVSLTVGPGELVGMLGPNGAGKSTLLSLISGQRKPDAGSVRLEGGDPREAQNRRGLGLTPQETGLPPTLKVREVVDFVGGHYPDPVPTAELLEQFGLTEFAGRQTGAMSGGQKRRLAVALALVGRPRVILLDEPTTGLDLGARNALWAAIRQYNSQGGTVLLTSHNLDEVQSLAERVVVINDGKVIADDIMARILEHVGQHRIVLTSAQDVPNLVAGVTRSERRGDKHELFTPDADQLVRSLVRADIQFSGIEVRGATLEEAFGQLIDANATGRSASKETS